MPIILRNPHSVLAVLETRHADVLEVVIPKGQSMDAWEKVARVARELGIPVSTASHRAIGRSGRGPAEESTRMSIAEAHVRERESLTAEDLFRDAKTRAKGRGLWLALDGLQDPHNVGAIFRTAAFFGVQGILLTQDRSASLTATVYDVAAGGMERMPFALQTNLQRAFEIAKDSGLWILGTSEHSRDDFRKIERDRPWLLVLGNEEKGMRRLTEETCDVLCGIPCHGKVTSLNVSVAAGVLISALTGPSTD